MTGRQKKIDELFCEFSIKNLKENACNTKVYLLRITESEVVTD